MIRYEIEGTMNPGDMIEWVYANDNNGAIIPGEVLWSSIMFKWVYKYNNIVVHENENLWSSTMNQWVPVGVPAFLVGYTKDEFFWLSEKGLFHARRSDMWGVSIRPNTYAYVIQE